MKEQKNDKWEIEWKYNLSVYWSFLRKYKLLFSSLLVLVLIVEALFIVDKYILKLIIDGGTEYLAGNLLREVFMQTLAIIAIVFLSVVALRIAGQWIKIHLMNVLESKMILDLKRKFFNHILRLSHDFHTTHKTGSLISRMLRGAGSLEAVTDIIIFHFAPLILQLIIVIASIIYFSKISVIIIIITVLSFISYGLYIQHIQQGSRLKFNNSEDIEKGFISDVFANIDSIKYFGKEQNIKRKYEKITNKTKFWFQNHLNYFRWFDFGLFLILGVGTFFIVYFPLMSFLDGKISLGTLAFIYTIFSQLVGNMFGFVWGMRGFYRSMADFQDLFYYGKIENEIKDGPNAKNLEVKNGEIEFKNVSFHYGRKKAFNLNNFNLKIKKNEKIALIGHSGCGKTSLMRLLYRLYDVESGKILIDGKNINEFKQESLRSELSIVPQECVLFDDTIYNNIKFSNPNATRKQIMNAIKFAQLDKVIRNFPKKENTIVGERGVKLSGGEKQRVSIARAILANKKILVLDEATSSLDSETENEIQKALQKLLQGRTSIIIAHRLSTIMNADRIIVMKSGKIIQQGKHKDLIRQKGEYKKLWNLQKGGYIK
jgi:ATP-binding cassette subfamily B protein